MRFSKLLKLLAPLGLAVAVVSINPDASHGQFPSSPTPGAGFQPPAGGFPPGGFSRGGDSGRGSGRGFSADDSFNRLVQSTGGSGDTLDYSRVPADQRERFNRFAQMTGSEQMPTSGVITRQQYTEVFNKRMEAMRSRGFGPPGGGFGGSPGGFQPSASPGTTSMTFSASTTPQAQPGMMTAPGSFQPGMQPGMMQPGMMQPGMNGAPSFGRDERGRDRGSDRGRDPRELDEYATRRLSEQDKDRDGRVSLEEADSRVKPIFAQYDTNRDGFIDANEYRNMVYQTRGGGTPPPSDPNQPPQPYGSGAPGYPQPGYPQPGYPPQPGQPQGPAEEQRPTVYRYGKLPKDLPSWFEKLDTDKDGQVGLYEWVAEGKNVEEFQTYDLNTDGLLTAEEYLRHKKYDVAGDKSMSGAASTSGAAPSGRGSSDRGSGSGFSFFSRPSSSGRDDSRSKDTKESKEDRKEEKRMSRESSGNSGGNPFRRN